MVTPVTEHGWLNREVIWIV